MTITSLSPDLHESEIIQRNLDHTVPPNQSSEVQVSVYITYLQETIVALAEVPIP